MAPNENIDFHVNKILKLERDVRMLQDFQRNGAPTNVASQATDLLKNEIRPYVIAHHQFMGGEIGTALLRVVGDLRKLGGTF